MANLTAILARTPFVVIGAVATRLYMPERATEDVDILILTRDAASASQELHEAGARMEQRLSIGGTSWTLPDGTRLDIVESEQPWVAAALATPNYSPDGLPVIALPYLVIMKLEASRGVDVGDLTRMLGAADDQALQEVRAAVAAYYAEAAEDLEGFIQVGKLEYQQGQQDSSSADLER